MPVENHYNEIKKYKEILLAVVQGGPRGGFCFIRLQAGKLRDCRSGVWEPQCRVRYLHLPFWIHLFKKRNFLQKFSPNILFLNFPPNGRWRWWKKSRGLPQNTRYESTETKIPGQSQQLPAQGREQPSPLCEASGSALHALAVVSGKKLSASSDALFMEHTTAMHLRSFAETIGPSFPISVEHGLMACFFRDFDRFFVGGRKFTCTLRRATKQPVKNRWWIPDKPDRCTQNLFEIARPIGMGQGEWVNFFSVVGNVNYFLSVRFSLESPNGRVRVNQSIILQ